MIKDLWNEGLAKRLEIRDSVFIINNKDGTR